MEFLAIRDNETGMVPELRELSEGEKLAQLVAQKRQQFAPPRYELVIGMAESLDAFLGSYPRFKRGGGSNGHGNHQDPGAGQDGRAAGAQHGDGSVSGRPR